MATVARTRCRLNWLLALCLLVAGGQGVLTAVQGDGLPTVGPDELYQRISENTGSVVLVNFWASWCPPCLKEFPDIIRVYNEYHSEGLEVLAISMNSEEEMEDIEEFLGNYDPPFPVFRADSLEPVFYRSVREDWYGEIPATLILDPVGNAIHFYKKQLTYEDIVADVTALLP